MEFTAAGALRPAASTVTILEQRQDIDLGPTFASPNARTAAAQVELGGQVWYVVAREMDGVPDYIPVTSSAASLDAFLVAARAAYASGEGLR